LVVFPPNTRFEYSNIGMKILDAVIQQVSGSSYADYLQREVFRPLGMKNSAVGRPAGASAAVRYGSDRKPMPFYLTDHPGSGDVWSSAHDMARFLAFHMGTPLPGQRQILSSAVRLTMQRKASDLPMAGGSQRRDLGANWVLSTVNGHPQVWHSGGQPGVSTVMSFYPDQKLAFVLLANSSAPLFPIAQAIRNAIAPEVSPKEDEGDRPPPQPIPFQGKWVGTVTNHAGQQPLTLTFGEEGEVAVQFADKAGVPLKRPAFAEGALTGQFDGVSNMPEAKKTSHNFSMKVTEVNGELVGQLIAQGIGDNVAFMLPSFVRLRAAAPAR
jgi:CubicO group peptidase (beta-lactamase class C family)